MLLFHERAIVAVLGSGSRGNCTYVGDGRTGVLVDCGVSTRQVYARMEAIGLAGAPIDAVLVTHEHADHVAAARVLDARASRDAERPLPFFMTPGTRRMVNPKVLPRRVEAISSGRTFRVGTLQIEAIAVPHDTPDPVSYTIEIGNSDRGAGRAGAGRKVRVGVITDLGRSTRLVEQQVESLDVAVMEFNHDLEMLLEGSYPWQLKQRIRGPHGHLSNDQAADLVREHGQRLRHVVLAHLSEENNSPEKAWRAAGEALRGRKVDVRVGEPDRAVGPVEIDVPVYQDARPNDRSAERPSTSSRTTSPVRGRRHVEVPVGQMSMFG